MKKSYKGEKRMKNKRILKERGITLIALVVTIVVLLILAGVTINAVFSDSGIIKKAQEAQNKANESVQKDMEQINTLENWMNSYTGNVEKFTVKFCNYDGTVLQIVEVEKGGTAKYTEAEPIRQIEDGYKYKFKEWVTSKEGKITANLTNISSNLEIYANYSRIVGMETTDVTMVEKELWILEDGTTQEATFVEISEEGGRAILEELKNTNKTFKEYFNSENDIDSLDINEFITLSIYESEVASTDLLVEIAFSTVYSQDLNFYTFLGIIDETGDTKWIELVCEATENRKFKYYFPSRCC